MSPVPLSASFLQLQHESRQRWFAHIAVGETMYRAALPNLRRSFSSDIFLSCVSRRQTGVDPTFSLYSPSKLVDSLQEKAMNTAVEILGIQEAGPDYLSLSSPW
jgi:hypothetical protein